MGRGARQSWGVGGEARRLWASPLPPLPGAGPGAHATSGDTGNACLRGGHGAGHSQSRLGVVARQRPSPAGPASRLARGAGTRARRGPLAAYKFRFRPLRSGCDRRTGSHSGACNSSFERKCASERDQGTSARVTPLRISAVSRPLPRPPASSRRVTWVPLPGPDQRLSLPVDPGPLSCSRPGRPLLPGTDTALIWTPTTRLSVFSEFPALEHSRHPRCPPASARPPWSGAGRWIYSCS